MDYDKLRKYQRKEKNTAELVNLKKEFYEELKKLVKNKKEKYQEEMSAKAKKKLDNIKRTANDLYRRREKKIVSRALRTNDEDMKKYNLTQREEELYQKLRKTIQKGRKDLEQTLEGKKPLKDSEKQEKEKEKDKQSMKEEKDLEETKEELEAAENTEKETQNQDEHLNKVMVKILKEVPQFVTDNLKKLGPYQPDTKIKLPEEQAEILSEKGLAEKIEGDENEDT